MTKWAVFLPTPHKIRSDNCENKKRTVAVIILRLISAVVLSDNGDTGNTGKIKIYEDCINYKK